VYKKNNRSELERPSVTVCLFVVWVYGCSFFSRRSVVVSGESSLPSLHCCPYVSRIHSYSTFLLTRRYLRFSTTHTHTHTRSYMCNLSGLEKDLLALTGRRTGERQGKERRLVLTDSPRSLAVVCFENFRFCTHLKCNNVQISCCIAFSTLSLFHSHPVALSLSLSSSPKSSPTMSSDSATHLSSPLHSPVNGPLTSPLSHSTLQADQSVESQTEAYVPATPLRLQLLPCASHSHCVCLMILVCLC
jgi:hypothetical protein